MTTRAATTGTSDAEARATTSSTKGRRLLSLLGPGLALGLAAGVLFVGGQSLLAATPQRVNGVKGPVGECQGGETAGYANGRIPRRVLCPVGETDQGSAALLRPDAAAAFLSLARAWQADHGTPLCLRSAYRTHKQQAALYARMPDIAAPPGASDHGWGTAVDLCGGIANASSLQHAWMQLNGPEHGWIQPEWARATGSRPEPWHWEYVHGPGTFGG
jgi:hypothetical protein